MFRNIIAAVLVAFAASLAPSTAQADDEHIPICEPIKSLQKDGSCPDKFAVVELPDSDPQLLGRDEGFVLYHECRGTPGGLKCTGWPQEQAARGNLGYQWSFESAGKTLLLAPGTAATEQFACVAGEQVTSTLTITNGRYRATASETWTCGKTDR